MGGLIGGFWPRFRALWLGVSTFGGDIPGVPKGVFGSGGDGELSHQLFGHGHVQYVV